MKNLSSVSNNKDVATKEYVDNKIKTYYGTCSTGANESAKVVECADFVLEVGAHIYVNFGHPGTRTSYTLNVNNTGDISVAVAKGIYSITKPTTTIPVRAWYAHSVVEFTYDGTYWLMSFAEATSTTYGMTKLINGFSTTDNGAVTPLCIDDIMKNTVTGYTLYSSTSTYNVGDRVRYVDYIYECNTAISTAEDWTPAHWTIVDDLQTQINNNFSNIAVNPSDTSNMNIWIETPTEITFTLQHTSSNTYTATEGMTFGEWVNSEYNTIGATMNEIPNGYGYGLVLSGFLSLPLSTQSLQADSNVVIQNNEIYNLTDYSSGGGAN